MIGYALKDISISTDRHKIYVLMCSPDELPASISYIQSQNITSMITNCIQITKEDVSHTVFFCLRYGNASFIFLIHPFYRVVMT